MEKGDKKQRITNEKIIDILSASLWKLRQYPCIFKVREAKDCGDKGLEVLKMKLENMATCVVSVRLLFSQNPRRDRDN